MTRVLLQFSASHYSRFVTSYNKFLNKYTDGNPFNDYNYLSLSIRLNPYNHSVTFHLLSGESLALVGDRIVVNFDGFSPIYFPRHNCRIICASYESINLA